MKLSAPNFLEMWMDSLASVGRSSAGLAQILIADAADAGFSEDVMRSVAGGDLDAYLATQGLSAS